jgi:hypothetical protein
MDHAKKMLWAVGALLICFGGGVFAWVASNDTVHPGWSISQLESLLFSGMAVGSVGVGLLTIGWVLDVRRK